MTLFLEDFKKYSKLLLGIIEKGHQTYESIHFDFLNAFAYVYSSKIKSRIPFLLDFKGSENTINFDLERIYSISLENFLNICSHHDFLDIRVEENYLDFFNDKDSYLFPFIKNPISDLFEYDIDESKLIEFDSDLIDSLFMSFKYVDHNENSNLNGIFIENNSVISTDKSRFFEKKLSKTYDDINIPFNTAKLMNSYYTQNLKYLSFDNFNYFIIDNKISIVTANLKNLQLSMDVSDVNFKQSYDHSSFIVFKKEDIIKISKIIDPFLKNIINQRVKCFIKNNELIINIVDEYQISKTIPIYESSNNFDEKLYFWISFFNLKIACQDFDSTYLKFQMVYDKPATNITSYNFDNNPDFKENNLHIVVVQLKE